MTAMSEVKTYQTDEELLERLITEADLCQNEGAGDIAKLLNEASMEIGVLNSELARVNDEVKPPDAFDYERSDVPKEVNENIDALRDNLARVNDELAEEKAMRTKNIWCCDQAEKRCQELGAELSAAKTAKQKADHERDAILEQLREVKADRDDADSARERLAFLLTRVSNVLKGQREDGALQNWSDLAEVACALKVNLSEARAAQERAEEKIRELDCAKKHA